METLLLFLGIIIPQFVICAGIISGVDLLKDILEEIEERKDEKC